MVLICLTEKLFVRIENTLSAAADEGVRVKQYCANWDIAGNADELHFQNCTHFYIWTLAVPVRQMTVMILVFEDSIVCSNIIDTIYGNTIYRLTRY